MPCSSNLLAAGNVKQCSATCMSSPASSYQDCPNSCWLVATPVAAIIHALYSTLSLCIPIQTPYVHLRVQSSECHLLLASATDALHGTHSLRIVRPELVPWTDYIKYYARMTSISSLAYCKHWTWPCHDNIHWCIIWMFVLTMWYALVCKMSVCVCDVICFGAQNIYLCVPCLFAVLSWTCWNNCPDIATCSNCQNCNWKWAWALTLYNTIAQKCHPCIWHLVYSIPRSLPLLLVYPWYWPLISQHKRQHWYKANTPWWLTLYM